MMADIAAMAAGFRAFTQGLVILLNAKGTARPIVKMIPVSTMMRAKSRPGSMAKREAENAQEMPKLAQYVG